MGIGGMSTEGGVAGWVACDLLLFKALGPEIRPNVNEVKVEGLILTQPSPWQPDGGRSTGPPESKLVPTQPHPGLAESSTLDLSAMLLTSFCLLQPGSF